LSKVKQLIELMQPFVDDGKLLSRSYEQLSEAIDEFVFIEDTGQIIACAGLRVYKSEKMGEIYALTVNKSFHNTGTSIKLMKKLIQKASDLDLDSIFALSKYGGRFFFRHDFAEVDVSSLPLLRQKSYDYQRNSIIYLRAL
jgi:N-acetylglutamate synthase-like GNAT family acetyltransferase